MSKQFWAVIAVIVILFGGIFVLTGNKDSGSTGTGSGKPSNHVQGSTSTGVTLVEYGDFQCPYCSQFYPVVKQAVDKYKDQIQFQFVNLPLNQVHQNAFAAARAAEAASIQGKFWEMYDQLYTNQDPNGATGWVADTSNVLDNYFVKFAKAAGVTDIDKFKTDFRSSAVNNVINADIAKFKKTGLDMSTPTFILDGKVIKPGYDIKTFTDPIDAAIKAKANK